MNYLGEEVTYPESWPGQMARDTGWSSGAWNCAQAWLSGASLNTFAGPMAGRDKMQAQKGQESVQSHKKEGQSSDWPPG